MGTELHEQAESIQSQADFIRFVAALARDLEESPDAWENATLERFLAAMAAWTPSMDAYYANAGRPVAEPSWRTFAEILLAARVYE